MSRKNLFTMVGTVEEKLPNQQFKVRLTNASIVLCYLAGILKKKLRFKTSLVEGDEVKIEMSTYDLTRGRIKERLTK